MMRRALLIVCAVSALAFVAGCSRGKYADFKDMCDKIATSMDKFAADLEKATNGKEVAAAMVAFETDQAKFKDSQKTLEAKYPEMKDQKDPPAELKPFLAKLEAASKKMGEAMMKVMQNYATDPDVQSAMEKLSSTQ